LFKLIFFLSLSLVWPSDTEVQVKNYCFFHFALGLEVFEAYLRHLLALGNFPAQLLATEHVGFT
jgi:hypothetical protein